jgi:hypothetical protein
MTHTTPTFVATVCPFDNQACTDSHPLARVRYTNGRTFTGWRYVRHHDLGAQTGQQLPYWQIVDTHARHIATQIREMSARGEVPDITDFAQLRDHFDANAGWGPDIDALDPATFAAIAWRVTELLRYH